MKCSGALLRKFRARPRNSRARPRNSGIPGTPASLDVNRPEPQEIEADLNELQAFLSALKKHSVEVEKERKACLQAPKTPIG